MKKNDIFEMTIEDIGADGEGIGHISIDDTDKKMTVFVKDTVICDVAKVKIIKLKKNYAYGRLEEIITPSPYRCECACDKARSCGGCTLMHMTYEKQLEYKFNKVKNCLERIGGCEGVESIMEPIFGMENPYNYRNKMQFPVGLDKEGRVKIGFFAGRTHSIIDLDECKTGHPVNTFIISFMRKWINDNLAKHKNLVYNEENHSGIIRHIVTRVGFATGEMSVCIVINKNNLDENLKQSLIATLNGAVDAFNSESLVNQKICLKNISLNINQEDTNRILGDKCITIFGEDYITDYIGDIAFKISPLSFYQVNPAQTKVLYDKAIEYAGLTGNEVVWDMYCGIGTISLCLAKNAQNVYGVEIVNEAIEDAKNNAILNSITNAKFYCGKAEEVVPEFYRSNNCDLADNSKASDEALAATTDRRGCHPDVIVVDPPRKGCDGILLDTIRKMSPKRLVYVSCDPATLARDIKLLSEDFELKKVAVVDQFCHSGHVETACLLSRKS